MVVMSKVEQEAVARIKKWLGLVFLKRSETTSQWEKEPYKGMLFDIFESTYPRVRLEADKITAELSETWKADHSEQEWETVQVILRAWNEWLYAWDKHTRVVQRAY